MKPFAISDSVSSNTPSIDGVPLTFTPLPFLSVGTTNGTPISYVMPVTPLHSHSPREGEYGASGDFGHEAPGESSDLVKRKRRPRLRAAKLNQPPLVCRICGATALGYGCLHLLISYFFEMELFG